MAESGLRTLFSLPTRKVVCAPMVDQSELAFRMLCRKYGAGVCYTPMMNSKIFVQNSHYRKEKFNTNPQDRPLVVQFCGNDPDILLAAARMVENDCDAIDLNLGCPQGIARKGNYGSFLLTETDLLKNIVSTLHNSLKVPVTCKIRLLPEMEDTLALCHALEDAGCQLLTVHGRTRFQNKQTVGSCDWDKIKEIKQALKIPVMANGGIGNLADLNACMDATGVDGVMSSEALLENPCLFDHRGPEAWPTRTQCVREYLGFVKETGGEMFKFIKAHSFKLLWGALTIHPELRPQLGRTKDIAELEEMLTMLEDMHTGKDGEEAKCTDPLCTHFTEPGLWYARYWNSTNPEELGSLPVTVKEVVCRAKGGFAFKKKKGEKEVIVEAKV